MTAVLLKRLHVQWVSTRRSVALVHIVYVPVKIATSPRDIHCDEV